MTVRTETIEYQGYRIIAVEWLGQWQASVIPTSLNLPRPAGEQQCLGGTRTSAADKVFIGWFGPRWLATIVFAILVLDATRQRDGHARGRRDRGAPRRNG